MIDHNKCTAHIPAFDEAEATKVLGVWQPTCDKEWVFGNPASAEVRRRWPRFSGTCSSCGYVGIQYASMAHYTLGDW